MNPTRSLFVFAFLPCLGACGHAAPQEPTAASEPEHETASAPQTEAEASTNDAPADPMRAVAWPEPDSTWGTAHPLVVQRHAPDGRWVAACQARQDTDGDGEIRVGFGHHGGVFGDDMSLFLMSAEEPEGLPIGSLLGTSQDGDFVVYEDRGDTVLRSFPEGPRIPLNRTHPRMVQNSVFAFDSDGSHLVFVEQGRGNAEHLVVRSLADGTSQNLDVTTGKIWRAFFPVTHDWVAVAVVENDTNGSGALELPELRTNLAQGACVGSAMSSSSYGYSGDEWEWRFVRVRDGFREARNVRGWVGSRLVVQRDSFEVSIASADGTEQHLGTCPSFNLIAVNNESEAVVTACGAEQSEVPLRWVSPQESRTLEHSWVLNSDHPQPRSGRFIPLGNQLFDVRTGAASGPTWPVNNRTSTADEAGNLLEVAEDGRVLFVPAGETMDTARVVLPRLPRPRIRPVSGMGVVHTETRTFLVDLASGGVLGALPQIPLAISDSGPALILPEAEHYGAPNGPLQWFTPVAVE